jgi:IMP dehydrogenase
MREGITFDDVLLVPQKSTSSPSQVSTEVFLTSRLKLGIPLLSASMDTVTESAMAIALGKLGGLGVIHKNMSVEQQCAEVKKAKAAGVKVGAAISIGEASIVRGKALIAAGVDLLVTDVAHGHYYKTSETIKALRKIAGKKVVLVGGNVATAAATRDLIKAGADVVKVGVGPGSICTTRIIAGIGVPQLTAIMDAVKAAKPTKTPIIADGGIKFSGDVVKALAAGASAVMLGSLFAGTDEAPGKVVSVNGTKMKVYRGMGSIDAMQHGSNDRYLQADRKNAKDMIAEGVVGHVPYKGSVETIIYQLIGGLRQGLGYCGAKDIPTLARTAEFVRISNAGLKESHPHSLQKIQRAPNYQGDFL